MKEYVCASERLLAANDKPEVKYEIQYGLDGGTSVKLLFFLTMLRMT